MRWPRRRAQEDFDAEIRSHIEIETDRLVAEGVPREQARDEARRRFGNVTAAEERFYESQRLLWVEHFAQDLRYAARALRRSPGFSTTAVASLALAIAANVTVFALVDGLMLRPLPVADPDRLVRGYAYAADAPSAQNYQYFSYPTYGDLRQQTVGAFSGLAAVTINSFGISEPGGGGEALRAWGYVVSGNYFDVLGVRPVLGRGFLPREDEDPGAPPVMVISDGFWRRRFGADPSIIGRAVLLNRQPFTVIGVTAPRFLGTEVIFTPDVWVPVLSYVQVRQGIGLREDRGNRWLMLIGRLRPGTTLAEASAETETVARRLGEAYPVTERGFVVRLFRERDARPEPGLPTRLIAVLLLGVTAIVLLIACANVANLLLARGAARQREIGIRVALGAGRMRVVRQLLTESLLLAFVAGMAGVILAAWGRRLLALVPPPSDIPFNVVPSVGARVLLFTLAATVCTGLAFGIAPALSAARGDVAASIRAESTIGGGRRRARIRGALVIAQLALSTVLLAGAGLFVRSLQGARGIDPGFDIRDGLTVPLDLRFIRADSVRGSAVFRQVIERVRALPGVESAALISQTPLGWGSGEQEMYPQGYTPGAEGRGQTVMVALTGLDYFRTMGIPVLAGRDFTRADAESDALLQSSTNVEVVPQGRPGPPDRDLHSADRIPEPVLINQTFARRFWPGEEPLGKTIRLDSLRGQLAQVVGVVKDGKYRQLGEDAKPHVYRPFPRVWYPLMELVVRAKPLGAASTGGTEAAPALFGAVRRAVATVDPAIPLSGMVTIQQHMGRALMPARTGASIVGAVALLALALASVGLYGVIAYAVTQRTREIGVRMALGARAVDVLRMMLGQGMRLAVVGVVVGIALALLAARGIAGILYGVSPTDATTFVVVAGTLAGVALLATYVPARRATRVDPMVALRTDN
jgi:putative ABC transport system permease protein